MTRSAKTLELLSAPLDPPTPFVDLAFSLYLFVSRLHDAVEAQATRDLFFFSREGFVLKEMFDCFLGSIPRPAAVKTHYLEVSRRSTFLPSLASLERENFNVLFRQYRRISLESFLRSLALEDRAEELAKALGVDAADLAETRTDLPADPLFQRLIELPLFRDLYDRERGRRSEALAGYIESVGHGPLPDTLHVVDVGWKGSIQDNLFNWANRIGRPARIHGYYVGLVAAGDMCERNRKIGLLFSNQGGITPGFRIFNENRSLFEVLLPAPHGAAQKYEIAPGGLPTVVREPFIERDMIEAQVAPIAAQVMCKFREIVRAMADASRTDTELFSLVCARHRRMVFNPSQEEIDWMLSVSHFENFGVFSESRFGPHPVRRR